MGQDTTAITIIGLRIPKSIFITTKFLKWNNICNCSNNNKSLNFCPDCGNKNEIQNKIQYETQKTIYEEIKHKNGREATLNNLSECTIFGYNFYSEYYGGERNSEFIYVYIYKGVKDGPRSYVEDDIVECFESFEGLIEGREEMRKRFTKSLLEENEFVEYFGIYTLVEVC